VPPFPGRVELVVEWSCLASDNLKKGVAGEANREKLARYASALELFRRAAREQYSAEPAHGPVSVIARFWMPDRRALDVPNFTKGLLDGLKGIVIVDDRWAVLRELRLVAMGVDAARPRCEILVEPFTQD
jgi:Holliday junction resolvase RusA-like endonuclease